MKPASRYILEQRLPEKTKDQNHSESSQYKDFILDLKGWK